MKATSISPPSPTIVSPPLFRLMLTLVLLLLLRLKVPGPQRPPILTLISFGAVGTIGIHVASRACAGAMREQGNEPLQIGIWKKLESTCEAQLGQTQGVYEVPS